ncbi:early endosome antigen 1-like [Trichogramma pretiosum]|uniref:early endosome antigen 1-like n=1 Tax=Trichogramma pretiosum TaxID=7493 RepID=UPI0006C9A98E|nr:early endosome antigen 1-like [Trichogramma pretiosum]XP_014221559.1 early endosome antigen 1-like [Trichogramma pretiosum]
MEPILGHASDSSKADLDSIVSTDSLQSWMEEFRLQHDEAASSLEINAGGDNCDVMQKLRSLELENERLGVELASCRLELDAKSAANRGLKAKISELHVQAQDSLQERQRLRNLAKDAECKLAAAENSTKWYQAQMHEAQARSNSLRIELDTYQSMLRQKHQTLVNVTAKWKQLNDDYLVVMQKHRAEKDQLQAEIDQLKTRKYSCCSCAPKTATSIPPLLHAELSARLQRSEEELEEGRAELRALEQRLTGLEVERVSSEASLSEQRKLTSAAEERWRSSQAARVQLSEEVRELRLQLETSRSEAAVAQGALLAAQQDKEQVQGAIEQLQAQLTKMIAQHRLLRSRNADLEHKLTRLQGACDDSRRLRSLSYSANASLFKRLRQERRRASALRQLLLAAQPPRQRARSLSRQESKEQNPKCLASSEESSIDEGYVDNGSNLVHFPFVPMPSPKPLDPQLLGTINELLDRSKDFWQPVNSSLDKLRLKLEPALTPVT